MEKVGFDPSLNKRTLFRVKQTIILTTIQPFMSQVTWYKVPNLSEHYFSLFICKKEISATTQRRVYFFPILKFGMISKAFVFFLNQGN